MWSTPRLPTRSTAVLFSININDFPDKITKGELELFADDSTAFEICDNHPDAFTAAQDLFDDVDSYSGRNGFQVHTDRGKTEIMFISKKPFIGPLPDFKLVTKSVSVAPTVKCLGLLIDNKLSWDPHCTKIIKDFKIKLKNLYKMRFLNQKHLRDVYFKGIIPSVLYCIAIWGSCTKVNMDKINSIHLKAARFIERLKKSVPDCDVLYLAKWKSISWYYKRRSMCITHTLLWE